MKTADLIKALAADHAPVARPIGHTIAIALAAGTVLAALLFVSWVGWRPDIAAAAATPRFLAKFAVTLSLAVAAGGLVLRLASPGADARRYLRALAVVPAVLAVAVTAELVATPATQWGPALVGSNATICLTVIPVLSVAPLLAALAALRFGAPTRPYLAGAACGLVAGGIAATLYASHCTDDSPLFVATWYSIAVGLVTAGAALLGGRLLRW